MAWFKKKSDPISAREQDLSRQIATLERQIREMEAQSPSSNAADGPRLRSTALPLHHPGAEGRVAAAAPGQPIFEPLDRERLQNPENGAATPEHYNELGVRKYDLIGAWKRLLDRWQGPTASNPKLVNYLAAGSIHGLRPLRYEKRIARNRFLVLVALLVLVLLGMFKVLFRG